MTLRKNLKSDEEYVERYNRITISVLKRHEASIEKAKKLLPFAMDEPPNLGYLKIKYEFQKDKANCIEGWKSEDIALDQLIAAHIPTFPVSCHSCDQEMQLNTYYLKENNTKVIYVYSCVNKHFPMRMFYQNGKEHFITPSKCPKCNGELLLGDKETKTSLTFTEECTTCNYTNSRTIKLNKETKITQKDLLKYCKLTEEETKLAENFIRDLQSTEDFLRWWEENEKMKSEKEEFNVDNIQTMKITDLEKELSEVILANDYTKFQFGTPDLSKFLSVQFSLQDPTSRNEKESINLLRRLIKSKTLQTNWRLMSDGITFRLGFLTGKLRAFEDEEDLIKLAKQAAKQGEKRSSK